MAWMRAEQWEAKEVKNNGERKQCESETNPHIHRFLILTCNESLVKVRLD